MKYDTNFYFDLKTNNKTMIMHIDYDTRIVLCTIFFDVDTNRTFTFFSFIFIFVALFPACHYSFPLVHSDGLDCSKDAVYLSPHKFIGGVGTPGKPVIYRTKENK